MTRLVHNIKKSNQTLSNVFYEIQLDETEFTFTTLITSKTIQVDNSLTKG